MLKYTLIYSEQRECFASLQRESFQRFQPSKTVMLASLKAQPQSSYSAPLSRDIKKKSAHEKCFFFLLFYFVGSLCSNCVKEAESSPVLPQCSTSCGLGAVWRTLSCSSGSDPDCDPAKRPAPAQRCYLRPCASWKVPEWSKVRSAEAFVSTCFCI